MKRYTIYIIVILLAVYGVYVITNKQEVPVGGVIVSHTGVSGSLRVNHSGVAGDWRANVSRTDIVTNGLVAHYTFDGKHLLQNVKDLSGFGNNAFSKNFIGTTTVIGKIGQGLGGFNATQKDYEAPTSASLAIAGPNITLATWVYFNADPTEETALINKWSISAGARSYFIEGHYSSPFNRLLCGMSKDGGASNWHLVRSTSAVLLTGVWQHVACSYNGTNWTLYYNGASVATTNDIGSAQSSIYTGGTQPLRLGGYDASVSNLNGALDDSRVYNRSLSASEIFQLYQLGI